MTGGGNSNNNMVLMMVILILMVVIMLTVVMMSVKLIAVIIKMGLVVLDSIDDGDVDTTIRDDPDCGVDKNKVGFSSECTSA